MKRPRLGRLPIWVLAPLLALSAVLTIARPGESTLIGAAVEGQLLDLRYRLRGTLPAPTAIVIAAIDDRTIEKLQRFPVPRDVIASAVSALAHGGADTIAIDLLFAEQAAAAANGDPASADKALADVLRRADRVVLAASLSPTGRPPQGDAQALLRQSTFTLVFGDKDNDAARAMPAGMILPLAEFAESATLGHANVAIDRNGSLNRIALALGVDRGTYLPALALEAVRQYLQLPRNEVILKLGKSVSLGARRLPTDVRGRAMVNYYGGSDTFETVSLIDIVEGTVPAAHFFGKLVFIGSTATAFGDLFRTPFDKALPGIAVHATLAANLLDGSLPLRDRETWLFDIALALAGTMLAFFAANQRSLILAGCLSVATLVLVAGVLQTAFSRGGMWLDAVTQLYVILIVCTGTLAFRFILQRRQARVLAQERDNLARYQSPLIADWLAGNADPVFDEDVQDAAVLFVDVADFTARSELLGPQLTAEFLRELHSMIERSVLPYGGVITQFTGDGAMIVFGMPRPARDDAARALLASHAMLDQAAEMNCVEADEEEKPSISLRLSLHYGPVSASLLGGAQQGQISVSGDTVNVASRLQDIAKQNGAQLVVSQQALQSAREFLTPQALTGFSALPKQALRGRKAEIDLWSWRTEDTAKARLST